MWTNWSGSLRCQPARLLEPADEDELAAIVRDAAARQRTVRVVGAGHSSSPLVQTDDTLVSLTNFQGLLHHDAAAGEAVIAAGMTVHAVGTALAAVGLALHNTGDVDVQTLAGAIGTGTHGTGITLGNLSTMLLGGRLVTASGAVRDVSIESDAELIRAARVSLGTLGIFTRLRVRVLPAFRLRRREWCTTTAACLEHLDDLIASHRNFDFYWYPRSDEVKLRTMDEPARADYDFAYATCVRDQTGWSHEILPRTRELKFDEVEYALPLQAGPACFARLRQRILQHWRREVGWRLLYRTIAADDSDLSPMCGRDSVTISLHHNAGLPYEPYFRDVERVLRDHGGRPHWGKKHALGALELAPLYPQWDRFQRRRTQLDPTGVFLTPYLRELLGAPLAA